MDIRLPNITGRTEREQMDEIRRYLYYLANMLNFLFSGTESSDTAKEKMPGIPSGLEAQNLFNAIKGLIINSETIYRSLVEKFETEHKDIFLESGWNSLSLADENADGFCRYRKSGNHVYIECSILYADSLVNGDMIPDECRPKSDIYRLCPTNDGFCRICADVDGQIRIDHLQTFSEDTDNVMIYGYLDYFID